MSRASQVFSTEIPTTVNKDGYPAYERNLEERFLQTLLTNTIGNTFYADEKELLQESFKIHNEMLQKDPDFYAKALTYARNNGYMRLQPVFGLVNLSKVNKKLFEKIFDKVVLIPSDLQDFFSILNGQGRGEGGRCIKRVVSKWLNDKLSEYWTIKYNGKGRGYSLGDVINTVHPKPKNETVKQLFQYLTSKKYQCSCGRTFGNQYCPVCKDKAQFIELKFEFQQINQYEQLKQNDLSIAEQVQLIKTAKLPHEVVTGVCKKMTTEIWEAVLSSMPVFATLRNLNVMDRNGVLDKKENLDLIINRLNNPDALKKSKILPFRFIEAFNVVSNSRLRDVLRQAVELTFENLPDIQGKTAVFLDISGSMQGDYLKIGSIFGLALYKKTKGNGIFWLFDETVVDPRPSMYDSILTQAEKIRARGGTDTGAPVRALMEKVDNIIIIITDEQQNAGRSFYQELKKYRQKYNKDVKAFIIDLAPYQKSMVPPNDKNTWYIYGWSDQVLSFISSMSEDNKDMVKKVKDMEI